MFENYFTEPCQSTILQICRVKIGVQMKRRSFTFDEFDRKVVCFSSNSFYVLIPLCQSMYVQSLLYEHAYVEFN